MTIPTLLKNAIKQNDLVIFVGSGLSLRFELPSWKKLVIDVINETNNENYKNFIPLLEIDERYGMSALEVLDKLKEEHVTFRKYIKDNFNIKSKDFTLHEKLLKLSNSIITTNYDNAFELASNNNIIPTLPTSTFNISELEKNKNPYIFKIHGSFEEPDNCILFNTDYDRIYGKDNALTDKLKSIFINKTILFIGFSFNDPDLNLIFEKLDGNFNNFNKHCILTPNPGSFNKYKFLETIKIDFSEYETYIDSLIILKDDDIKKNQRQDVLFTEKETTVTPIPKIALLYPSCLDREFVELQPVTKYFDSLNIELSIGALNEKTLSELFDYDAIILITEVFKSKLYIEDKNLISKLVSLDEIVDFIPNDRIPLILITDQKITPVLDRDIIYISSFKKQLINRFIHKTFKNRELMSNDKDITFNLSYLFSNVIEKGNALRVSFYGNNRDLEIGKKCLSNVVGRVEEQATIIQKILNAIGSDKLVNIKASGGIGKTTLTKKVAYELYNRGFFKQGVNFKSCESIKTYNDFEELLIEGFNLYNIINFREHLLENYSSAKLDLLIILDNFETVINILPSDELKEVIELIKFATDYSNIIITSRDSIGTDDFEDVYSLTSMTTDDALILFQNNYGVVKNIDEIKILRADILEDLLNNNPLAIKLVTNSRTRFKHIIELKEQLTEHFFESINEDFSNVFKHNADLNIERTKSIYQSINYSYTTLKTSEKTAFEILSLFPDGISLSDFKKCFTKSSSSNTISDKEFRILRDKSLIEDYNGILQLQPIIRRFADFQFQKQPDKKKEQFCLDAYTYNCFILDCIRIIHHKRGISDSLKVYAHFKNNLLKALDYISNITIDKDGLVDDKKYFLNYIYDLEDYIMNPKQLDLFTNKIKSLILFFEEIPHSNIFIEVLLQRVQYYYNEFDDSYEILCGYLSVDQMIDRKIEIEDNLEKRYRNLVADIHSMEGYSLQYIISLVKNNYTNIYNDSTFFYLGISHKFSLRENGFYYFEYKLRNRQLDVDKLENYISGLYMEEHLEKMQCTYTLSKIKDVNLKEIRKLVVTNPYTQGLKDLMFAFNTPDNSVKKKHFRFALRNLYHIKYYYLEALYYYCVYLKDINDKLYSDNIKEGLRLSKQYHYQYIQFLFENIEKDNKPQYVFSYDYYSIDGLEEYINSYNEVWEDVLERY